MARIAMWLYGEDFVFFQHVVSDLGATVTPGGLPNQRSPYVFFVQMVVSGVMCLRHARLIVRNDEESRRNRVRLLRLCAAGFFFMPAPHDLPATYPIHALGGGFIFFSLWVLTMIYLTDARRRGLGGTFWIGMVVLQSTVIPYAFFFAVDSESQLVAQGFGLLGLVGTLIWTTQALARSRAVVKEATEETARDTTAPI